MERKEVNIYEAIEWLSQRIKIRKLSDILGRSPAWITILQNRKVVNGVQYGYKPTDVVLLQRAWDELAERVSVRSFIETSDADVQLSNWKFVNELFLGSFFMGVLQCEKRYFENRCRTVSRAHWSVDEITRMNASIQATSLHMKSVKLALPV